MVSLWIDLAFMNYLRAAACVKVMRVACPARTMVVSKARVEREDWFSMDTA